MSTNRMSLEWSTAFLQPGPSHSNQRKMLRKSIGPQRVASYNNLIQAEVAKLMLTLQNLKGSPVRAIQKYVCSLEEGDSRF
jgi:cytochrome P450